MENINEEAQIQPTNPIYNVPIKGIAGWIVSILLLLVIFFFWQNKDANDKLLLEISKRAQKYEDDAKYWQDKYLKCNDQNTLIEIYKNFGVLPGPKTLSIIPKESINQESYEN